MKAIVTVVGKDQVGIIAGVCNTLADYNINVLDISQTIMQGYFTMSLDIHTRIYEAFRDRDAEKGVEALLKDIDLGQRDICHYQHI